MNEETKDAEETQGRKRAWAPEPWDVQMAPSYGPCDMVERRNLSMSEGCGAQIWGYDGAEVDARARLIAAAPELFEALKTLADAVAGHSDWLNWKLELDQAEAALVKALGGQP